MTDVPPTRRLLMQDTLAATASAVSGLVASISFAAFVFTGPLEPHLARASGSFIVGGAVVSIAIAWRSQFVPSLSIVQDAPAVVAAAVLTSVVAASGSEGLADVFVIFAAVTFISGFLMWFIGRFGLGNLLRYVPSTVVGAFIAGTGWLLIRGGFDVMLGMHVELSDIGDLFSPDLWLRWVPGVALGLGIWYVGRSDRFPPMVISLAMAAAVGVFFAIGESVSSVSILEADGWLVGPFADGAVLHPVGPADIADTDWGRFSGELPGLASVVGVAVVALLLNLGGLQFVNRQRIDVDQELRSSGVANMVVSPLGALPGFVAIGDTVLMQRMGATTRRVPIAAGVLVLVLGALSASAVGYLPRPVAGALLIAVGAGLLIEWALELPSSVDRVEAVLGLGVFLVIAFVGILEGIAVGILVAGAVFIIRYSRIDPVRTSGSGHVMRSRVDRTPQEAAVLEELGHRAAFLGLDGYLFLGSLARLEDRIHSHLDDPTEALEVMLIDMTHVSGVDATAYRAIGQLVGAVQNAGTSVIITGAAEHVRTTLQRAEPDSMAEVRWDARLDDGFEFVESMLLAEAAGSSPDSSDIIEHGLAQLFEAVTMPAGQVLMSHGDEGSDFYLVVEGTLTASTIDGNGHRRRLRQFGRGTTVGEIAMLTGSVRSADVYCDTDVRLLKMSRARYEEVVRNHPELAVGLLEHITIGSADRVRSLSMALTRALATRSGPASRH